MHFFIWTRRFRVIPLAESKQNKTKHKVSPNFYQNDLLKNVLSEGFLRVSDKCLSGVSGLCLEAVLYRIYVRVT